ncbi:putative cholinesterase [Podospora australis]|uniref:Cholinesterase n=1 Tax=Podospora australis TaxID=1536484 RepID=A0AAN6WYW4_9PEZI|nr:putative cholinesterase [Podospora australis]
MARRFSSSRTGLSGVAVLLLVWVYLHIYGYGYGNVGSGIRLSPQKHTTGTATTSLPPKVSFAPAEQGQGSESSNKKPGEEAPAAGTDYPGLGTGDQNTNADTTKPPILQHLSKSTATATTLGKVTKPTKMPGKVKGPTVVLPQGTYVGTTNFKAPRFNKSVDAFRGVPFAQDASGENRFRPPQPLPKSDDTFDAIEYGQFCPVEGVVYKGAGENCLNANIYRPAGLVDKHGYYLKGEEPKQKANLPVVVYIHGGGFNVGRGIERNMASFVAWAEDPIVAVNFNYRVGALGFLPSDITAKEGLLNLGLRDQQFLLEWVQQNIGAFGGDAGNVTIMGLSAGAHSIGHHIMHYAQQPSEPAPFHKAILESGATTARAVFYPTHPRHLIQFREFLAAADAGNVPEEEIFSHLRSLPLEKIVAASKVVWDKYVSSVTWPFQPVIDGPNPFANSSHLNPSLPIIPDLPITSWLNGTHLKIPIITGYNSNEGTVFIPPLASTNEDFRSFFQGLIPTLTPSDLDALEKLYPDPVTSPANNPYLSVPEEKGPQWARLDAAYSHYAYICPVLQTAHYLSLSGVSDVYVYKYAATSLWGTANHGDEAPVVAHDMEFLGYGKNQKAGLRAVSDAMHGMFSKFIASPAGNPSIKGEEDWPRFVSPLGSQGFWKDVVRGKKGKIMVFGEGNNERDRNIKKEERQKGTAAKVEVMSALEKEACRFWWERVWLSQGLGRHPDREKIKSKL